MQNNKSVNESFTHDIQYLGWGLKSNTTFGFAACSICHSTPHLVLYFPCYIVSYVRNMGKRDLPYIYALARGCAALARGCAAPLGLCIHIWQIPTAHVAYVM